MHQIIVHAFADQVAVVEVLFASQDKEKVAAKYQELQTKFPNDYLAIYDLPLDVDLDTLPHYPSVEISKEDFE
ncbi:phosphoribosylaminoimidazole carboxylase [Streptococcus pneumoniae]